MKCVLLLFLLPALVSGGSSGRCFDDKCTSAGNDCITWDSGEAKTCEAGYEVSTDSSDILGAHRRLGPQRLLPRHLYSSYTCCNGLTAEEQDAADTEAYGCTYAEAKCPDDNGWNWANDKCYDGYCRTSCGSWINVDQNEWECPADPVVTAVVIAALAIVLIVSIYACTKCQCCKECCGKSPRIGPLPGQAGAQTVIMVAGGAGGGAIPVAPVAGGPQQIQVQVPAGVAPGQTFQVNANGKMVPVTVPAGVAPGTMLSITV